MQDLCVALLFFAMLLAPCIVAMWAGRDVTEPPPAFAGATKGGGGRKTR